jgi:hypothetical protein
MTSLPCRIPARPSTLRGPASLRSAAALALGVGLSLTASACGSDETRDEATSLGSTGTTTATGGTTTGTASGTTSGTGTGTGTASGTGTGSTSAPTSGTTGDTAPRLDIPDPSTGTDSATTGAACEGVVDQATNERVPADIIFVVDNSGSMKPGNDAVQDNLNRFSQQIAGQLGTGNVRVILLSQYPDTSPLCLVPLACDPGICIQPPLGAGGCPSADSNPPDFVHVDQKIESSDGLQRLIERYPTYQSYIREDSVKHVVMISDDNSNISADQFDTQFKALSPAFDDYFFHGIINISEGLVCSVAGGNKSDVYIELIARTMGVGRDLCALGMAADFQSVFDEIAMAVDQSSPVACSWEIPPPPAGEVFNRDQVNVIFDPGTGSTETFGRVDDPAQCASVTDGWYYDDPVNPTRVLVCPQTCTKIQAAAAASIEIQFGCATIPAG